MAYNYKPSYDKNRNDVINMRRELKKMGIPSSQLPKLPKKQKIVDKQSAKIMREVKQVTKDYIKASKYLQNHPEYSDIISVDYLVEQYNIKREKKRQKSSKEQTLEQEPINLYEQYVDQFEVIIDKIPESQYVGYKQKAYPGKTIRDWWSRMNSNFPRESLGRALYDAENSGIKLTESVVMDSDSTAVVKTYINEFMYFLRSGSYITNSEYEDVYNTISDSETDFELDEF